MRPCEFCANPASFVCDGTPPLPWCGECVEREDTRALCPLCGRPCAAIVDPDAEVA